MQKKFGLISAQSSDGVGKHAIRIGYCMTIESYNIAKWKCDECDRPHYWVKYDSIIPSRLSLIRWYSIDVCKFCFMSIFI